MDLIKNMFGVIILVLSSVMIGSLKVEGAGQLSYDFYERTCPQVEDIVRDGLQSLFLSDHTSPAALLRLMFHDCQVQGCDASILIDESYDGRSMAAAGEMGSRKNSGIRKRESISMVKSMVEAACPQQVSCADILILAARESVAMSGGPVIRVPLGRRDSSSLPTSKLADALLPPPDLGVDGMLRIFAQKGMTVEESVAIIGAHTLGITHCFNILSRIYGQQSGTAAKNMEPGFDLLLSLMCPPQSQGSLTRDIKFVMNDPTSFIFDNQYYISALSGRGILRVDAELASDPRTSPIVQRFASNQGHFFRAFSSAFLKLSSSGVLTGDQGVIRERCSIV